MSLCKDVDFSVNFQLVNNTLDLEMERKAALESIVDMDKVQFTCDTGSPLIFRDTSGKVMILPMEIIKAKRKQQRRHKFHEMIYSRQVIAI